MKIFLLSFFVAAIGSGCASSGMKHFDAGPVAIADQDVHRSDRVRCVGPIIETQQNKNGMRFVAVRPFYSKIEDPVRERAVSDYMWPLGMIKQYKGEIDWRFFPSFGHDFDESDSNSRHRWSVFPLIYGGQGINGEKYFAFFPFGGVLRDFIGIDRISFFLFPLYVHSQKDDNKTYTFLWPFFSFTKGDDLHRWRVFPFYGVSKNDNRFTKRFVMWPFWTSVKYDYPDQKGGGFILWPLFGKVDVGDSYARSFLPPFFKWEVGKNGHRALFCPWPIIRYKRGEVNQFYVWPLFGTKTIAKENSKFFLWPIARWRKTIRMGYLFRRVYIMPFLTYESKTRLVKKDGAQMQDVQANEKKAKQSTSADLDDILVNSRETDVFERYFKFWPLFSYQREDDVMRFRTLALWPMKNQPAIERNWAPLWSLYGRERDGDRVESELLWGLYRHQYSNVKRRISVFPLFQSSSKVSESGDKRDKSWSLLYGLLGYKREGLHKQFKMLYFLKFGDLKDKRERQK